MSVIRPTSPAVLQPTRSPVVTPAGLPWGSRVPGGVAAWTPADITGAHSWYDPDDVITSGSSVTTATDKIGHVNLTQASSSAQPTLTTRWGRSALSYDGGDSLAGDFGHTHAQPSSIIVVFEPTNFASLRYVFDDFDGSLRNAMWMTSTPEYAIFAGTQVTGGTPTAAVHAAYVVFNGASSALYIDDWRSGQEVISGNAGTSGMSGITLGARNGGSFAFLGHIGETVLVNGAISADDLSALGDYLTAGYSGLTVTV